MAKKKIKSATDQRPFIMIYQDFLDSDLLDNHYQKLVYIYLKKFADSNHQCFPSIRKLSILTKIGTSKIKQTLAELEEKGLISKENRRKSDGGKTSNLYTLYDYAEIWNAGSSENDVAAVAEELSEAKLVAELRARGYTVTKVKELDITEPTKVTAKPSTQLNQLDMVNTIPNTQKSQELERYSIEQVHIIYDYDVMIHDYPDRQQEIESVMWVLHTALNNTKPTIRVAGQDKPSMVVIGKLMKLGYTEIMYCIEKYVEQTERIKNPTSYMLTLLYNAGEQMTLDIANQVQHDVHSMHF